jgi:hypothetical protein
MKYTVDYLPDKNIVGIKLKGRLNYQIVEEYSKEAIKLARKNNCNKFIIDHRETSAKGSTLNIHTNEDELQQFGFKDTDRIAILIKENKKNSSLQEDIIKNNSWCIIKYFYNKNSSDAIAWLN